MVFLFFAALFFSSGVAPAFAENSKATHTFAIGTNDFLIDGNRFQIRCGEIHAARVPMEYWLIVCKWPRQWA
jgi:beta-galactosidase